MKRTALISLVLILGFILPLMAQDSNVQIQKAEDRTGAVVTTHAAAKKPTDNNVVDRFFSVIEKGIMGVATPTSYWTGKAVDQVTVGFEKVGTVIFSRFFRALDLKTKFEARGKATESKSS